MNAILLLVQVFMMTTASNEFMIDTSFVLGSAWGQQDLPATAFGGGVFLTVWVDLRENYRSLYAARLTEDGKLMDSIGVRIVDGSEYYWVSRPDVAFGDSLFYVVYEVSGGSIYGLGISAQNEVVGSPVLIGIGQSPCIAYDGTNFCVTWIGAGGIKAARVSRSGKVLDGGGILVGSVGSISGGLDLAYCGGRYLVVYTTYHDSTSLDIAGMLFSFSGNNVVSQDVAITQLPYSESQPSVSASSDKFLIVYVANGDFNSVRGVALSATGEYLDDFQLFPGYIRTTTCCCGAKYFVAGWVHGEELWATKVNAQTLVVDDQPIKIAEVSYYEVKLSAHFGDSVCLVAYGDGSDIEGFRLGSEGGAIDSSPFTLSCAGSSQIPCDMAFNGEKQLLTWINWKGDTIDVLGTLDPRYTSSAFYLLSSSGIPAVLTAAHSTEFLVLCGSHALRVDSAGEIVSNTLLRDYCGDWYFLLEGADSYICLSCYSYLITVPPGHMEGWGADFYSYKLNFSGSDIVYKDTIAKLRGGSEQTIYVPSIFLWAAPGYGICGITIWTSDWEYGHFSILDLNGVVVNSTCRDLPFPPAGIAYCNNMFLVAGQGSPSYSIVGLRVGADGHFIDNVPFYIVDGKLYDVTSVRNGFLIIFSQNNTLKGMILNTDGKPEDIFTISSLRSPIMSARVRSGNGDSLFVAWSQFVGPPYNSYRLFGVYLVKSGIEEPVNPKRESEFAITQFYPDPFSEKTLMRLSLFGAARVSLKIYDAQGRLIKILANGTKRKGMYQFLWGGEDENGEKTSSGVYFYQLTVDDRSRFGKVVVIRR